MHQSGFCFFFSKSKQGMMKIQEIRISKYFYLLCPNKYRYLLQFARPQWSPSTLGHSVLCEITK